MRIHAVKTTLLRVIMVGTCLALLTACPEKKPDPGERKGPIVLPGGPTDRFDLDFSLQHDKGYLLFKLRTGQDAEALQEAFDSPWAVLNESSRDAKVLHVKTLRDLVGIGIARFDGNPAQFQRSAIAIATDKADVFEWLSLDYTGRVHANDPKYPLQWGLENDGDRPGAIDDADVDAFKAWSVGGFTEDVKVGVVDSGVDKTHEDLSGVILNGHTEVSGGDEHVDLVGHGTMVAGIIVANADNALGIAGLARRTKIIPVQVFEKDGTAGLSALTAGMAKARALGAQVVNASWGIAAGSAALKDAICKDLNTGEKPVLTVASAGNGGVDIGSKGDEVYPALFASDGACPNVLAVTATDHADELTQSANWSKKTIELAAPGWQVLSTMACSKTPCTRYRYLSGTSAAAPHASAVAALILAKKLESTPENVKARMLKHADKVSRLRGRVKKKKRLNAHCPLLSGGCP